MDEIARSLSETGARSSRRFAALPTDSRALASARLPASMRVLVASVPGAPEVLGVGRRSGAATATSSREGAGDRERAMPAPAAGHACSAVSAWFADGPVAAACLTGPSGPQVRADVA